MQFDYFRGDGLSAGDRPGPSNMEEDGASDAEESCSEDALEQSGEGEGAQEDIEDLVAKRDAVGGSQDGRSNGRSRCNYHSAEAASMTSHCRLFVAHKLEGAGSFGSCSTDCGHLNCQQVSTLL